MQGILNGEELAIDKDRWREVVVVAKKINRLYYAKKNKHIHIDIFPIKRNYGTD